MTSGFARARRRIQSANAEAVRPVRADGLIKAEEGLELVLPREERRARCAPQANRARRLVLALAHDAERSHGIREALHVDRRDAHELEAIMHEALGRRADQD